MPTTESYDIIESDLTTAINKTLISVAQNSVSAISSKQTITFNNLQATEDVSIGNVKQVTIAVIDNQKFLSIMTSKEYDADMTDAVSEVANNNQALYKILAATGDAELAAKVASTDASTLQQGTTINESTSDGVNSTSLTVVQKNIARVVSSFTYSSFSAILEKYTGSSDILFENIKSNNIDIENIGQYAQIELIGRQIANVMVKEIQKIAAEEETVVDNSVVPKEEDKKKDEDEAASYRKYIVIGIIAFIVVIAIAVFIMIARTMILGGAVEQRAAYMDQREARPISELK